MPAIVGGLVVAVLVVYGILSPSAVLYGGLFGAMLLMHAGGHGGHGDHGDHGGGPTGALGKGDSDGNADRGSHGCH